MSSEASDAAAKAGPLENGRKTIAVLAASMGSGHSAGIAFGAADYAREHGYNVLIFAGGPLNNPDAVAQARSRIFELVEPAMIDGVIVPLSPLTRYATADEVEAFLRPFAGKPIINVGTPWPGLPTIAVDHAAGMTRLLQHLIIDHGYRHIALACGPENHIASREKLALYRSVLEQHGIAYDPAYVVHGDLNRNSSGWCAEALFDQRGLKVDVIVTVNDNQAFSIIDSLRERGMRVPQDIAVTGSMDILEASVSTPSLTTIHEPVYELGWLAARTLIQALEGRPVTDVFRGTSVMVRQSCGCSGKPVSLGHEDLHEAADHSLELAAQPPPVQALAERLLRAAEGLAGSLDAQLDGAEVAEVARRFLAPGDAAQVRIELDTLEILIEGHVRGAEVSGWLAIIPALQRHVTQALEGRCPAAEIAALHDRFESLFLQAAQKAFNYRHMVSDKYINAFRELTIFMNAAFSTEVIRRLAVRELNVSECHVCLYEDQSDVRGQVKNILSIKDRQLVAVPPEHLIHPAPRLLPACVERDGAPFGLVVLPMSFRAQPVGYVVLDLFDRNGVVYENLQALLASALKNEIQIQQLKEAEEKFSDIALATSDWLWETDADGRYTFCSEGVQEVLGYTAEEMIGRSLFDFVLPTETNYLELVRNYLIPYHLPLSNMENINIHKDGHEVTLIVSAKPIVKNGELVGYRGAFKDTTAIKEQENKIRQLAYTDMLTGLPNRTLFHDRLNVIMGAAQRDNFRFGILFLDLDGFKFVNDTLGHDCGDLLLQKVAERLSACLRQGDTMARLGGDEFTVILSRIEREDDVINVAQRIVSTLNSPIEVRGHQLFVTTSVGVAVYPNDGNTSQSLLKNADKAMYKAKEQGKNRFIFYDHHMEQKNSRRMVLEPVLHKALNDGGFKLVYQPQVNARTGRIVGVEALIRLFHPELGAISPFEFIALAEEIGLIERIGDWVFDTACRQCKAWQEKGYRVRTSVNVSALQLKNVALAEGFLATMARHGVDPHMIEIEITENAVIENEATAKEILQRLSDHGVTIAIDDFGTGYSSLSSLKKFPIDTVKIDRSFINDSIVNTDSASIINAIIHMAKSLNLNVIAEGVERTDQLELLRSLDCNEIQGYLFSRPLPPEEVEQQLASGFIELAEARADAAAGRGMQRN